MARQEKSIIEKNILILCEDSVSFNRYIELYLKKEGFYKKDNFLYRIEKNFQTSIEIKQAKQNSNPLLIINEAKNELKYHDIVFCEFDYDGNAQNTKDRQQTYKQVMNLELDSRIKLINFNLCFENWLLCHFNHSSRIYINSDDVIKELKIFYPNYKKGKIMQEDFDNLLYKNINNAISNARNIEKQTNSELQLKFYTFIEFIEELYV